MWLTYARSVLPYNNDARSCFQDVLTKVASIVESYERCIKSNRKMKR